MTPANLLSIRCHEHNPRDHPIIRSSDDPHAEPRPPCGEGRARGFFVRRSSRSVQIREGVELIAPALDVEPDAATGREIER